MGTDNQEGRANLGPDAEPSPSAPPSASPSEKSEGAAPSNWRLVLLFSATLFLSALLLFSVQPIFAKMLLPLVGGAPAVWNTAMLFYQAALLAGYAYAHWASRSLPPKVHLASHLILLALPFIFLPFGIASDSAPVGSQSPVPWMLSTMLVGIGLPFFVVSSTGPLLQRWFSRTGDAAAADPYFLYAASNLGSMLGLLGYPFLVEPSIRLSDQSKYWAFGYIGLVLCILGCGLALRKSSWLAGSSAVESAAEAEGEPPTWPRKLRWIALAFVPSSLMLGVTQFITTDVAAVPLLWVVPLALYLLTFTIVFAKRPLIPHVASLVLMPVTVAGLAAIIILEIQKPTLAIVGAHLVAFFFVAMVCHGEMAKDRPPVRFLTEFYLWMSIGGVLGGFFNAIVAPVVFPLVLEYPLALALAGCLYPGEWRTEIKRKWAFDIVGPLVMLGLLIGAVSLERAFGQTSSIQARQLLTTAACAGILLFIKRPLRFGLAMAVMLGYGNYTWLNKRKIIHIERSFFGVSRVEMTDGTKFHSLFHGTTLHGMQWQEPEHKLDPVSYYFPNGPIGVVLTHMNRPPGGHYAVVGLGSGTLVAYGREGESWTYYEIDPVVEKIARDPRFFTFVNEAKAKVQVKLGDARISLKASTDKYDLLMLDAYSSDAVPIHLLTEEAVRIYIDHLTPTGMIAFHISNKHLNLEPVVHEICKKLGFESWQFRDLFITPEDRSMRKAASDWILAFRPGTDVKAIFANGTWEKTEPDPSVGLWTDDFSSIWTVYNAKRS